jgi:hypothetical protein
LPEIVVDNLDRGKTELNMTPFSLKIKKESPKNFQSPKQSSVGLSPMASKRTVKEKGVSFITRLEMGETKSDLH